jgi:hypothetical protein
MKEAGADALDDAAHYRVSALQMADGGTMRHGLWLIAPGCKKTLGQRLQQLSADFISVQNFHSCDLFINYIEDNHPSARFKVDTS